MRNCVRRAALPQRAVMAHCVRTGTIRKTEQASLEPPWEERMMPTTNSSGLTRRGFAVGAGATGLLATAAGDFAHAQGGPLKVGVLLPRSGAQAGIGQDCQ